jgi:hypothetical protein
VNSAKLPNALSPGGSLPDNFVPKILRPKHGVHQHFQVVAGGRIAVQIDGAGVLKHTVELDQARGHHGEVSHHVALSKECFEGTHGIGDAVAALDDFFVGASRVLVPYPRILEGHDLGAGAGAVFFGEEDVVVLAAIEGRVEIDQVDGFVLDVLAEDAKVIPVIELVFLHSCLETA